MSSCLSNVTQSEYDICRQFEKVTPSISGKRCFHQWVWMSVRRVAHRYTDSCTDRPM
ncbi:hypothetical protein [Moorena sp. SIO3I6]|uniref:hypothetical protein n=1 Tax=Moorena sp. SIO3I6 TaxID=2607831 RepID=UPI0013F9A8B1|nr:hypothetical protein [Moorena sp. SIO3I6]NEP26515.1 hypothetical protein [Moorena sp. SIO3I6]